MTNSCHVKAPADDVEPTHPVREKDLVLYRAKLVGYHAIQAAQPKSDLSFEAYSSGVDLTLDYLRVWDQRGKRSAADEVL